jgi:hypothetical protein
MKYINITGKGWILDESGNPVSVTSGGSPVSEAEMLKRLALAMERVELFQKVVANIRALLAASALDTDSPPVV